MMSIFRVSFYDITNINWTPVEICPPRFGQRQVFCYIHISNAVLRLLNLIFKMNSKFKTAQNRISNMKKGRIRTP